MAERLEVTHNSSVEENAAVLGNARKSTKRDNGKDDSTRYSTCRLVELKIQ